MRQRNDQDIQPTVMSPVDAHWMRWLTPLLIAVVTFGTFYPVLWNEFLLHDDDRTFLANLFYRGLSLKEVEWMWSTTYLAMYRPLTWMTYALDYKLWGLHPSGYHLTSLALHSTTAVLVYLMALRLLLLAQPRAVEVSVGLHLSAAATALFFAIHPLRVEPVAWASDRATILAGPFFVGCLLAYLRAWDRSRKETPSKKWLSSAVLLYALSLLAKPVALGLPVILIILDIYPIKSLSGLKFDPSARRIWWWKVPFLLCALAGAGAVFLAKAGASTKVSLSNVTLALGTPAFYLWKSFVPFGLSYYERPLFLYVLDWRWLLAWSTVIGLTVLAVALRRYWPAGLAGWSCYLLLLAPSLGLVRYGTQMAADRY